MIKGKFAEFKKNFTQTVKDHAPEIIAASVPALALVAFAIYAFRHKSNALSITPDDVEITEGYGGEGLMITSAETLKKLLEEPSKICYKIDDQHHYSLAPNDCSEVH